MTRISCLVAVVVTSMWLAPRAAGQDLSRQQELGIRQVTDLLAGSWRSAAVLQERGGDGRVGVVLHATPVEVVGMDHAIYVEIAREDALDQPYYQTVFELMPYGEGLRLRTHEFRLSPASRQMVAGTWAVPELWRTFSIDDFVATIDLDLAPLGDGNWIGESPHAYPTSMAGAVEMVSFFELGPARLATADRGLSASGEVLWGNTPDNKVVFTPYEPEVMVDRRESGVIRLIYSMPEGDRSDLGWSTEFTFVAWMHEDSRKIFSSDLTKRTVRFIAPTRQVFQGWVEMGANITTGTLMKAFVPARLAYSTVGRAEAGIPPDADVVIWAKALDVYPDPVAIAELEAFEAEREARERGEQPAPQDPGPQQPSSQQPIEQQPNAGGN